MDTLYTPAFFDAITEGVVRSAKVCVPLILKLVQPQSVVDFGCGQGHWLSEFARHGVEDVVGVDGDYVQGGALAIAPDRFLACDLTQPTPLGRRFDLALSLEVGEHLPERAAEVYLQSLTAASDCIVFSAATPGQGGVGHVNEQWAWYWQDRFARLGYHCLDALRPALWTDERVTGYYRQNLFLYVRPAAHPGLVERFASGNGEQSTLVQTYILKA